PARSPIGSAHLVTEVRHTFSERLLPGPVEGDEVAARGTTDDLIADSDPRPENHWSARPRQVRRVNGTCRAASAGQEVAAPPNAFAVNGDKNRSGFSPERSLS